MKQLLIWLILTIISLTAMRAQEKATITRFNFECIVSVDYDIWDDDYSNDFTYENDKKQKKVIRTLDTLFSYAQEAIGHKLNVAVDKKKVSPDAKQNMIGKITGFPNEKVKDVAATGKYAKLIEVFVTAIPGGAQVSEKRGTTKRKYKIDMIVEVRVYDGAGNELEKYKKRTSMDEMKETVEERGVRDVNDLSGNEIFTLFTRALDNTFENKK